MSNPALALPADYADWLASLKQRIQGARQRALLSANQEQIRLYHDIGRDILDRQSRQGWGAKVIDRVSSDLRAAFPGMKGLSTSNLKYMRFFAQECPDRQIGLQTADQLPWFHIVAIITKLSDPALRETENIPLSEDLDTYFKREVLPHAPDAWIDHEKTKIGYEIPFNRHFYVFQPPRPLAEIDAELKGVTDRILTMIGGLTK